MYSRALSKLSAVSKKGAFASGPHGSSGSIGCGQSLPPKVIFPGVLLGSLVPEKRSSSVRSMFPPAGSMSFTPARLLDAFDRVK